MTPPSRHTHAGVIYLVPIAGPVIDPLQLTEKPGGVTLGRHEQCDLFLPADEKVSRFHARFDLHDGRWFIADLNSRWGTFVNGIRITPGNEVPLSDGDLIRITPWTFTLSPTARRRGLASQNDSGHTIVRAVTPERVRPLADDMLALLLESAAAIHSASNEKQLAELVLDAAARGTGLTNAAMLRPIDPSSGQVDVIAARMGPGGSIGAAMSGSIGGGAMDGTMVATSHVMSGAIPGGSGVGGGVGGGVLGGAGHPSFSRSLINAASNGVVAELSGGAGPGGDDISQSIVQMKINSAICAPLMLGNTVAAFLYLDSRGSMMQALRPNASAFCVALSRIASLALANLKRIEMEKREERIRSDLAAAAVAQKWIMPQRLIAHGPLTCLGESRPGQYVGGDFFDIIPISDKRVAVALGDVTGKGITASVLMTAAQGFLHASLLRDDDAANVLNHLNAFIQPRRPESRFVTMWLGVFDLAGGTLTYVDAGHSFAMLRRADGRFEQLNKGAGLPVGLDEAGDYRAETIGVGAGDQVMVVSDGIVEQFGIVPRPDGSMAKRQFQMEGLQAVMARPGSDRGNDIGSDIVQDVFAAVIAHAGTDQLSDDATAVWVKWSGT